MAVLAGDFLFAQSSWFLANLDNLEVRVWASSTSRACAPRPLGRWAAVALMLPTPTELDTSYRQALKLHMQPLRR